MCRTHVVDAHHDSRRRAAPGNFFHRDGVSQVVEPCASLIFRDIDTQQPQVTNLLHLLIKETRFKRSGTQECDHDAFNGHR